MPSLQKALQPHMLFVMCGSRICVKDVGILESCQNIAVPCLVGCSQHKVSISQFGHVVKWQVLSMTREDMGTVSLQRRLP